MTPRLPPAFPRRLSLPDVTLCAVTSVNVDATVAALRVSLGQVAFGACKLFTDATIRPDHPEIDVVSIDRIGSSADYSRFMLSGLIDCIETAHCLVVQWDGHVLDAGRWRAEFLDCDYIGARWPQFDDAHTVGNGGFSLRSRALMEACRDPAFDPVHPEDMAIGRVNRTWLEERGMRFASPELADLFATERAGAMETSFGYHGVFNMPRAIGNTAFWDIYRTLDDHSTVRHDFADLLKAMARGRGGSRRAVRMIVDHVRRLLGH